MKCQGPLGFRAVTDRRPVDREARPQNVTDCAGELFDAGFDAPVVAGPGASRTDPVTDAQGASIGEGVRFDIDIEASRRGLDDDPRISSPQRRCASQLLERPAKHVDELRSDVEQWCQREVTVVELAMRHAKAGRLVRAALVPKEVEVDAPWTPSLVCIATAAEAAFGPQQHRQELCRGKLRFYPKRGVEIARLWPPQRRPRASLSLPQKEDHPLFRRMDCS